MPLSIARIDPKTIAALCCAMIVGCHSSGLDSFEAPKAADPLDSTAFCYAAILDRILSPLCAASRLYTALSTVSLSPASTAYYGNAMIYGAKPLITFVLAIGKMFHDFATFAVSVGTTVSKHIETAGADTLIHASLPCRSGASMPTGHRMLRHHGPHSTDSRNSSRSCSH